jgi:hypothetical protein
MTKAQVEETLEKFSMIAESIMESCGSHDPISIFFTESGPRIVSSAPIMEDFEKAIVAGNIDAGYALKGQMADSLKKVAEESEAFGVITTVEAWAAAADQKDIQVIGGDQPGQGGVFGPLARFDKNRKEVLTMAYEFKMDDGSRCEGMIVRPMTRVGEKVSLGKPERFPGTGDGRLTKILK